MKIFVVKHMIVSHVLGVFETEQKAKEAIRALGEANEEYHIQEFKLNHVNVTL